MDDIPKEQMTTHQTTIAYWFGPEAAFGVGHAQEAQASKAWPCKCNLCEATAEFDNLDAAGKWAVDHGCNYGASGSECQHDWQVESYHYGDDGRPDTAWSKCSKCGEESEDDF